MPEGESSDKGHQNVKMAGLDADKGELQRYLSSIAFCPPILINHASLDCTAVGSVTLRVLDRKDSTGATVDLDVSEEGQPLTCRAVRPRIVGKQAIYHDAVVRKLHRVS
jgi:hypothetical protein